MTDRRPDARFHDALMIQQGACNPSGIARSLVEACDEAMRDTQGTERVRNDIAVRLIVHQLAYLCRVSELDDPNKYGPAIDLCEDKAGLPRGASRT